MGKKRKRKAKGRTKGQKTEASPDEVTSDVDVVGEAAPEEPPPVDAVIDLDEDLDDPLARAELVAAVAGLEADAAEDPLDPPVEESTDVPQDGDGPEDGDRPEDADGPEDTLSAEPPADIEGAVQLDTDAEYGVPPDSAAGGEDAPLIGPDALVALSEFRREGVATLPEELILDLGDATTPEERDRLLAAALAHVEMQDAIYRVPLESGASRRWKGIIATAVFVMAIVLVGLPPAFLVPEAPTPLTVAETAQSTRMALLMQAEQIEAFQARAGRLPSSISEVETAVPGVRYVRSSNRLYQLIAYAPDGDAVVYDSASPDPSFAAAKEVWARLKGDS